MVLRSRQPARIGPLTLEELKQHALAGHLQPTAMVLRKAPRPGWRPTPYPVSSQRLRRAKSSRASKGRAGSAGADDAEIEAAQRLSKVQQQIMQRLSQAIVGQKEVLKQVLIALYCQGHRILEGVPGLAKTLMISCLAQLLDLTFRRIQFTPDLMPSDITGTQILEEEEGTHRQRMQFFRGPIFGHIILGDEINRTPPKTQAALLQAMQEHKVTVAGVDYPLEQPFLVLGTQNPIEQEGTYPLPEAQLDRFMFKILVDYPSFAEELQITQQTTSREMPKLEPLLGRDHILALQHVVRKVLAAQSVASYAVQLARSTRPGSDDAPDFVKKYVSWGAGPRQPGTLLGAKATALLDGRVHVALEDIRYVARPVMRHRLATNFRAESDGVTADHVVEKLIEVVSVPVG